MVPCVHTLPKDTSALGVPDGSDTRKMTCLAADRSMRVMGHFFIMILMAPMTIAQALLVVSVLCCLGMTGHAGYGCMSGLTICFFVDRRHPFGGNLLSVALIISMAVEAKSLDSFTILLTTRLREAVTSHAGFVLFRQRGQRFVLLMAGTALLTDGHGRVDGSLTQSQLVVRLVAASAISVKGTVINLLRAMPPLIQVIEDIVVARYTLPRVK